MKLTGSERKLRKQIRKVIVDDNICDPDDAPEIRFMLALFFQCSADTARAARVAGVTEEERACYVRNLRSLRIIHHDRIEFGSLLEGTSGMLTVVNIICMGYAALGEFEVRQPCPHCEGAACRDGYNAAGAQRWKCSQCSKGFVYVGNVVERMKSGDEELRKALKLAKKGWRAEGIATQSGVTTGQAKKLLRIVAAQPEIDISSRPIVYTAGEGKTCRSWRPWDGAVYRVKQMARQKAEEER